MAHVQQYVPGEAWICNYCGRFEVDPWNAYRGYGYNIAAFKKSLVTPWKLDEAKTDIEHHRVCGRTTNVGKLFTPTNFTLYQCTGCKELYTQFQEAYHCCS